MNRLLVVGLAILFSSNAVGQNLSTSEALIDQLQSRSAIERTKASKVIFGAGIESPELYEAVASAIQVRRDKLGKDSAKEIQQEIAWHAKALGSSGDSSYMQLLIELSDSPARKVAKHAKKARGMLKQSAKTGLPYIDFDQVKVITNIQAEQCEFIKQQECSTHRSLAKCVDSHKDMASRIGANSVVVLHDSGSAGPVNMYRASMTADYYKCRGQQADKSSTKRRADDEDSQLPSYIGELKELAGLRDSGIITEDEFQSEKQEILDQN